MKDRKVVLCGKVVCREGSHFLQVDSGIEVLCVTTANETIASLTGQEAALSGILSIEGEHQILQVQKCWSGDELGLAKKMARMFLVGENILATPTTVDIARLSEAVAEIEPATLQKFYDNFEK